MKERHFELLIDIVVCWLKPDALNSWDLEKLYKLIFELFNCEDRYSWDVNLPRYPFLESIRSLIVLHLSIK